MRNLIADLIMRMACAMATFAAHLRGDLLYTDYDPFITSGQTLGQDSNFAQWNAAEDERIEQILRDSQLPSHTCLDCAADVYGRIVCEECKAVQ